MLSMWSSPKFGCLVKSKAAGGHLVTSLDQPISFLGFTVADVV